MAIGSGVVHLDGGVMCPVEQHKELICKGAHSLVEVAMQCIERLLGLEHPQVETRTIIKIGGEEPFHGVDLVECP